MPDIKFNCPHCQQKIAAPAEIIGTEVACPACGKHILLQNSLPGDGENSPLEKTETSQIQQNAVSRSGKKLKFSPKNTAGPTNQSKKWVTTSFDEFHDKTTTTHTQERGFPARC